LRYQENQDLSLSHTYTRTQTHIITLHSLYLYLTYVHTYLQTHIHIITLILTQSTLSLSLSLTHTHTHTHTFCKIYGLLLQNGDSHFLLTPYAHRLTICKQDVREKFSVCVRVCVCVQCAKTSLSLELTRKFNASSFSQTTTPLLLLMVRTNNQTCAKKKPSQNPFCNSQTSRMLLKVFYSLWKTACVYVCVCMCVSVCKCV